MEYVDEKIITILNSLRKEPESTEQQDSFGLPLQELMQVDGESLVFAERLLLNKRIAIIMPRMFREMPEEDQLLKYPSHHRPHLIFTNPDGTINLTFKHTMSELAEADMELFKNEMASLVKQTQKLTEWFGDGIREVQEHPIGYCEFMTSAWNTRLYNLSFFAELDGYALMGTFNCTEEEWKIWQPIARGMLSSLVLDPLHREEVDYDNTNHNV